MKLIKSILSIFILLTLFGCSSDELKTKKVNGEEFYVYSGYEYPSVLGAPELTKEEINNLTEDDAWEKINTYVDFLQYAEKIGFTSVYNFVKDNSVLLLGDYEDIGVITIPGSKALLYLKTNGLYYPIDMKNPDKSWLKEYPIDSISYSSIKELRDAVEKVIDGKTSDNSFVPEGYVYGKELFVNVLGKRQLLIDSLGAQVYEHAGYQIPYGLGLPEYTDEQIDEMIAAKEYDKVKDKIHTFADAVNYVTRANFTMDDFSNTTYKDATIVDFGNIIYADDPSCFNYTASGLELLMLNKAQCSAGSTLFNYLLKDDYPEIGYMHIRYTDDDGHAMIYIKGNDNKYYLINPVSYMKSNYTVSKEWLNFYYGERSTAKGCCDTLEELMNCFINSDCPAKGSVKVKLLYTEVTDGVFCEAHKNAFPRPSVDSTYIFQTGSKATCWLGNPDIEYADAKYASIDAVYGFTDIK